MYDRFDDQYCLWLTMTSTFTVFAWVSSVFMFIFLIYIHLNINQNILHSYFLPRNNIATNTIFTFILGCVRKISFWFIFPSPPPVLHEYSGFDWRPCVLLQTVRECSTVLQQAVTAVVVISLGEKEKKKNKYLLLDSKQKRNEIRVHKGRKREKERERGLKA